MKAVRNGPAGPAVVDVDEPGGDDPLMEVVASSICGTDLSFVAAGFAGFTYGHEFAGLVDGEPFAVEPFVTCGACEECRNGHNQRCVGPHANLGIFTDGGLSERIRIPAGNLVPLPGGLQVDQACLVEPMAVAWHGVRRGAIEDGERVAVVGGGSIGLLAVAAVRHAGHDVDLLARHAHQEAAGERLGAGRTSGLYDVVLEAAGSETGLADCAALARPGGRVVLLGVFGDVAPVPGPLTLVKELTWTGAMAYGRHDGVREVDEAAAILAAYPDIAATLITHRFPLADAAEAFRVATDRASGAIKVALSP